MSGSLFITGTGTDVGKTYVTALLVRRLHEAGYSAGYYKAALSGAPTIAESDAGYVKRVSGIDQPEESLLSYRYGAAVSPHLAAREEGRPVEWVKVLSDYRAVRERYRFVSVEGSGGIVCPIRYDDEEKIMLLDVVRRFGLNTLVVAEAGLGTINATVLTVEYLRAHQVGVVGVILNRYTGDAMQQDNTKMIEELTDVPILAAIAPNATTIDLAAAKIAGWYA